MSFISRHETDDPFFMDTSYEEDTEQSMHKREVRKKLEEQLERKRLREELEEEWDEDFDWSKVDRP